MIAFLSANQNSINPFGGPGMTCSGQSTQLPPMWPGFDSRLVPYRGLLVLALLQGFPGSLVFLPTETNTPNSNSTRIEDPHENQLRLMWLPLYFDVFFFFADILVPVMFFNFLKVGGCPWTLKTHFSRNYNLLKTLLSSLKSQRGLGHGTQKH